MFKEMGGALIFHPFRPNKRYYEERGEERREEEERPTKELKKWEWIKQKDNWYDYVEFSPHFHFAGYVGWLDKPKEGEEFVYKLMSGKNGFRGIQEKDEVFKLVNYLLSHVGESELIHTHTYVWVGNLSYRMLVENEDEDEYEDEYEEIPKKDNKKAKCKSCGGSLFSFIPNLSAFFRGWLDFDLDLDLSNHSIKKAKFVVLQGDIPKHIKLNVLEALDILQTGKPPPNYKDFLIEG